MWTPLFRGPDWMPITPKWGSFLHAGSQMADKQLDQMQFKLASS
jgi:hypothetical protein